MSRTHTVYASAYQPDRVALIRLSPRDKRTLTVRFGGVIEAGRTIESVTWRTHSGYPVYMTFPEIDGTDATVMADAQHAGTSTIKVTATLDDGSVVNQLIRVEVRGGALFQGEGPFSSGPTVLTATP